MLYLIELTFCFFFEFLSKLFIPEMNLAIFEFFSGQITKDVLDEGVLIRSIIESFVSNIFFLAKVTSPEYSQIKVSA